MYNNQVFIQFIFAIGICLLSISILTYLYLKHNYKHYDLNRNFVKLSVMNGYIANPSKVIIEDNIVSENEIVFNYNNIKLLIINPIIDIQEILLFQNIIIMRENNTFTRATVCRLKIKDEYHFVDANHFIKSFKIKYLNLAYPLK